MADSRGLAGPDDAALHADGWVQPGPSLAMFVPLKVVSSSQLGDD
jgi:hypothetical protein